MARRVQLMQAPIAVERPEFSTGTGLTPGNQRMHDTVARLEKLHSKKGKRKHPGELDDALVFGPKHSATENEGEKPVKRKKRKNKKQKRKRMQRRNVATKGDNGTRTSFST